MKTVINIIRYIVACFLLFGFFVFLSKEITLAFTYLILAISLAPFVYQLIFKNSKISNTVQIIIQIVVPIISFFVMSYVVALAK